MDASGEPLYEHGSGDEDRRAAQRAAKSLAASVAKLHGAVALPRAAQDLLRATEASDFKVSHLVRIIESDPALTGRLMRQVNSVHVASGGCSSVTQAVTMLGVRSLRLTALAVSALQLFDETEEPAARAIAVHAARTGAIGRQLAGYCGLAGDEMYTLGLLHDVGKLMLLRGSDLDYCELLRRDPPLQKLHLEERKRYGFDHAVLAGHVLASWKLPRHLSQAIGWHHQPDRAYRAAGQLPRMVALLRVAARLAHLPQDASALDAQRAIWRMPAEIQVLGFSRESLASIAGRVVKPGMDSMLPAVRPSPLPALPSVGPAPVEGAAQQPTPIAQRPAAPSAAAARPTDAAPPLAAPLAVAPPAIFARGFPWRPLLGISAVWIGGIGFGRGSALWLDGTPAFAGATLASIAALWLFFGLSRRFAR